ncbi:MAG: PrsW family intramembrane metalloprotease [Bacteroidales bacterium]|nr:PrsW family intramembrane metalloprotease [Bacteroidales bacterium]
MTSFVAALLPALIYIFLVYKLDNFSLLSGKRLLFLLVCGMLTALVCFGLFLWWGDLLPERVSDYVYPVVEEAVKAIPLLILAQRKRMVFFIDSVICGAAVGCGFSLLENVFYLLLGETLGFGTVLFRGLEVALIHMGCSAIFAAALMFAVRLAERRHAGLSVKRTDVWMTVFLFFAAPALHVLHNTFHTNPIIQFTTVFGAMAGLLFWIYNYDGDMIHRWLDKGLDKQVTLLKSIHAGEFGDTGTGKFLMSLKENFPAEVFFDLICFVQLYNELTLAARSRFMMREAGLDIPIDDAQKETYLSQYKEYTLLEKRLGRTARMAVAPIVKFYPADKKSLDDLLADCRTR